MSEVIFHKGTKANLPDSGMIEEGALYFCIDTGELFLGLSTTTLKQITDYIIARADGDGSFVSLNNPYNNSKANGSNSIVFAPYAGTSNGNCILVIASNGNSIVNGNNSAIIGTSGGATIPSGVNQAVALGGWQGTADESNTVYTKNIKTQYGDKIDSSDAYFHAYVTANGDVSTTYLQQNSASLNSIYGQLQSALSAITGISSGLSQVSAELSQVGSALSSEVGKNKNNSSIVDDNCKIVNVCKTLDLSNKGNKIEIPLPIGYVCNPTAASSIACLFVLTYNEDSNNSDSLSAKIKHSYYCFGNETLQEGSETTISKSTSTTIGLTPFIEKKIIVEVTSANTGSSEYPYVTIYGTIYCHKQTT